MSDLGVTIVPLNDGPYEITCSGALDLKTEGGRELPAKASKLWLCRCGHSAAKPFCDGSHRRLGFSSTLDTPVSPPPG